MTVRHRISRAGTAALLAVPLAVLLQSCSTPAAPPAPSSVVAGRSSQAASLSDDDRRALIVKFTAALNAVDPNALAPIVTPNVTWTLPGKNLVAGTAAGVDGIIARGKIMSEYGLNRQVQHIVFGIQGAAVETHNTGSHDGRTVDQYVVTSFAFEGGKISSIDTSVSDVDGVNAYFS
ncbi:MAG TPA: nuclear transport factor 2 family protein [Pseudonocardia sp.]|nr:nuclear transport factor 2 family protein [Pseudonocardia sp.]